MTIRVIGTSSRARGKRLYNQLLNTFPEGAHERYIINISVEKFNSRVHNKVIKRAPDGIIKSSATPGSLRFSRDP